VKRSADPRVDPRLIAELARSLRDELGARAAYLRLARGEDDSELARVLGGLAEEGATLAARVRSVGDELGVKCRAWSVFRTISGPFWSAAARWGARRFVLRLCVDSEETLARRYARFAQNLAQGGFVPAARACDDLANRKVARGRVLRAWVSR
jgi:hypothetical protein